MRRVRSMRENMEFVYDPQIVKVAFAWIIVLPLHHAVMLLMRVSEVASASATFAIWSCCSLLGCSLLISLDQPWLSSSIFDVFLSVCNMHGSENEGRKLPFERRCSVRGVVVRTSLPRCGGLTMDGRRECKYKAF